MTDALRAKAAGPLIYGPTDALLYGEVPITLAPLLHSYVERKVVLSESKEGPWWSHGQFTDEEMLALYEDAKAQFWPLTTWEAEAPSPTSELLFQGYRTRGVSNSTNVAFIQAWVKAACVYVYDTSAYTGQVVTHISPWNAWSHALPTVPYGLALWASETEKPAASWTEILAHVALHPATELANPITLSSYLLIAGHIDLTQTTANQNLYVKPSSMPATIS